VPRAPGRRALTLLLVASCAAPPVASEPREEGSTAELAAPDWRSWPRANPRRFLSKGHGYLWVDVHVPPEHAATYAANDAAPAPGFRVVMVGYDNPGAPTPTGLTLMALRPDGAWHYAVLSPDGKQATLQGPLPACIGCHRHAPRAPLFGLAPPAPMIPDPDVTPE
jgi:hypothetical protein